MVQRISVFEPVPTRQKEELRCAPRLKSLQGKRVGFLCHDWPSWIKICDRLQVLLKDRYDVTTTRRLTVSMSQRSSPQTLDEFKRDCDFIINGLGN